MAFPLLVQSEAYLIALSAISHVAKIMLIDLIPSWFVIYVTKLNLS